MAFPIVPNSWGSYHDATARQLANRSDAVSRRRRAVALVSWMLVIAALLGSAAAAHPVLGFTIDDVLTNDTPDDSSDDLLDAARWSNVPGSYAEQRVRGLGGGIEYTVASDFCTRLIPRFIDDPTCQELLQTVQQAFDLWAEGHPTLRFVDMTGRVRPELPGPGVSDPWQGFGAEIDIFALSAKEYPRVRGFGTWTQFWYLFDDPIGPGGRVYPGNTITSVDMVFNPEVCYHMDPALAGRGCNHFQSLMLHETGHALGLDHPDEFPGRNFETDADPTNAIPINCQSPTQGLVLSPNIAPQAVMISSRGLPQPVRLELTQDDLGGRNFLYPICPGSAP